MLRGPPYGLETTLFALLIQGVRGMIAERWADRTGSSRGLPSLTRQFGQPPTNFLDPGLEFGVGVFPGIEKTPVPRHRLLVLTEPFLALSDTEGMPAMAQRE